MLTYLKVQKSVSVCVCVWACVFEAHHAELAPGRADGLVLDHDAVIRLGLPGLCVLIRVVVQSLLLVVLVQHFIL